MLTLTVGRSRVGKSRCHASHPSVQTFTRLLVDADVRSIDEIKDAIHQLEKMEHVVWTTVFAPPGRDENRELKQFFKHAKIKFHPVERNDGQVGEANDDVLSAVLSACTDTPSFALLVSDLDFLDLIKETVAQGKDVVVLIPSK